MKKSELKNIIKECVREVILEEGMLSGIITEVARGLQGVSVVQEQAVQVAPPRNSAHSAQLAETKKQVLSAIGGDAYGDIKKKFKDPSMFEGTKPLQESKPSGPGHALAGVDPRDPGVDLSSIPGMGNWAAVATAKGRR